MLSHPKDFRRRFVRVALGQVGVIESGGENRGNDVMAYQSMTWLPAGPWPWCAAFVCWCYAVAALGSRCFDFAPDTPRAFGFETWADGRAELIPSPSLVLVGDIVIFKFSHVGIVSDVRPGGFVSVEGNTNSEGSREGDGVFLRNRSLSLVRSIVRLHES